MKKTVKKLIAENNEKRQRLNEENLAFYENFMVYVRASLLKDERAKEEVLMEMLDHVLLAQDDGKRAEDVFGKNPKQLADDVVANIPQEPFKHVFTFAIEIIATLFACYTVVVGIIDFVQGKERVVFIGNAALLVGLFVAVLAVMIIVFLKTLKNEAFQQKKSNKLFIITYSLLLMACSVGIYFIFIKVPSFGLAIDLGQFGLFSIGCVLALVTFIMKKIREQR